MNIIQVIGMVVVIGLLFGLGVATFDGLTSVQTPDSLAYNVSNKATESTAGYSEIYEPLVWVAIVIVFFGLMALLIKAGTITI